MPQSDAVPVPAPAGPADRRAADSTRRLLEDCRAIIDGMVLDRGADILNDIVAAASRTREESQVRNARTLSLHVRALVEAYRGRLHAAGCRNKVQ